MKITDFGAIKSNTQVKRRERAGQVGNFAELLGLGDTDEVSSSASLNDIAATNSVNMLALQEVTEEEFQRKKFLQRGKNLLDTLEKLRQQLLMGEVPLSTLRNLGQELSSQRIHVSDPELLALMDDIELRAAVELAKLEMANALNSDFPEA